MIGFIAMKLVLFCFFIWLILLYRTTPQHSVDQCRDGVANAPILPNKSQRLMQKGIFNFFHFF